MSATLEPQVLTLGVAARMLREAMRDTDRQRYIAETGMGRDVERFFVYFKTERGKTAATCTGYEYCLAKLCWYFADFDLAAFDGKHGPNLIRDFLRDTYADVGGGTWNTRVATVKAFFKWAFEESRIDTNPAAIIRYRQVPESERASHSPSRIEAIVAAQTERRDRIGVQLLGRLGLRRNELRVVQFRHVNPDTRELTVFGKGGTVKRLPVFTDLYAQLLRERLERQAAPDEHLLYPAKVGRVGVGESARMGVIWEDRLSPLSPSGIDKWWQRVLKTAGVEHFAMHELRHSAGTNFWRNNRDLRMTQKMMRHAKIETTARYYLHDDAADLAEAFDSMPAWEVE